MKTEQVTVERKIVIPGVGHRKFAETVNVPQAENDGELLEVFTGTEAERWLQIVEACNEKAVRLARTEVTARVSDVRKEDTVRSIKAMAEALKTIKPDLTDAELAAQLLGMPGVRSKLKAEGFVLYDENPEAVKDVA